MTERATPIGGLEGLAVIVTGGGTGIGRACAARLARDGAAVTICGRRENLLVESVDQIKSVIEQAGGPGRVQHIAADVTDEDEVKRVVEFALAPTGSLDGCTANAGGGGGMGPTHMQQAPEFTRVLHLNVLGTLFCMKHTIPHMVAAGEGSFVGMSSIAGQITHPYFGAYTAGKAGLEQLIRNAADEYGPTGIRFNAIRPGFISTEIMEGIPRDGEVYQSYIDNTPMGDVGEPEDVAALARFLVGPDSRWITGQVINVDGGHSLRRGPDFSSFLVPALGWDAMLAKQAPGAAGGAP